MKFLKSLLAWIAKPKSTEEKTMNLTALATALSVASTLQLTASEASGYTTSDSSVATVDTNGLVTGVAAGSVVITAINLSDATQTATLDLTVTAVVTAEPAAPVVPATVNTDVLKKLLSFMGHELDYCWDEVVALARKAL